MRPRASFRRTIFFAVVSILTVCLSPAPGAAEESAVNTQEAAAASHILDGKQFMGPTGEKGKKVHHEDVLSFRNGTFISSECFQYGFKGGPYTTAIEGDRIHFQAITISPTHGKMEWKGTLQGDTLEVDYSWTKERWFWTTYREYWFKGTLKK